jgi:glycosyltransferase involved in cell wall biosynthesis
MTNPAFTSKRMRIVHLMRNARATDGGPTRALVDHYNVMTHRGHDVSVLSADFATSGLPDSAVVPLRTSHGRWGGIRASTNAAAIARVTKADILHIHLPWDPINLTVARWASEAKIPYCVSLRGTLDDWSMSQKAIKKRLYMLLFARRLLERAAFVHCTAEEERRQSDPWYPRGKSIVIPNLVNLDEFQVLPACEIARSRFAISPSDRTVLFLSRIHQKKGLHFLIDAMPEVAAQIPNVRLIVAGAGDSKYVARMQRRASDAGIRADFVGHIAGELKLSLLRAADCFALPSSQENFGFALFEAALVGTPIVVSDLVDTWSELRDGARAFVVRQRPTDIATGITQVLQSELGTSEARQLSRDWAREFLSVDRIASMFEQSYTMAIAGRS